MPPIAAREAGSRCANCRGHAPGAQASFGSGFRSRLVTLLRRAAALARYRLAGCGRGCGHIGYGRLRHRARGNRLGSRLRRRNAAGRSSQESRQCCGIASIGNGARGAIIPVAARPVIARPIIASPCLDGTRLERTLLAGLLLAGAVLARAIITGPVVSWPVVSWSIVSWPVVAIAVLTGTVVAGPVIPRTIISGTILTGAIVSWAIVSWAIVSWAIVSWAIIACTIFSWPVALWTIEAPVIAVAIGTLGAAIAVKPAWLLVAVLSAIHLGPALALVAIFRTIGRFALGAHAGRAGRGLVAVVVLVAILVLLVLPKGAGRPVAVAELEAHLFMCCHHDAHIVLGVLVIALRSNGVAAGMRIAGELHVFLGDGLGIAPDLHIRTIRLIGAGQRIGCLVAAVVVAATATSVAVAATHAPVLAWSHRRYLLIDLAAG
jgi:hypothetical protein